MLLSICCWISNLNLASLSEKTCTHQALLAGTHTIRNLVPQGQQNELQIQGNMSIKLSNEQNSHQNPWVNLSQWASPIQVVNWGLRIQIVRGTTNRYHCACRADFLVELTELWHSFIEESITIGTMSSKLLCNQSATKVTKAPWSWRSSVNSRSSTNRRAVCRCCKANLTKVSTLSA